MIVVLISLLIAAVVIGFFWIFLKLFWRDKKIIQQNEAQFFYDLNTNHIYLVDFKYLEKARYAFFNYFELKKFLTPRKLEVFIRFLKTFSAKYQNTQQLVNFFTFIDRSEVVKSPTKFQLIQKRDIRNLRERTEVHVTYFPDSEKNFLVHFLLLKKPFLSSSLTRRMVDIQGLEHQIEISGSGSCVVLKLPFSLESELENITIDFLNKLKPSQFKWMEGDSFLIIYFPNQKKSWAHKTMITLLKKSLIKEYFVFDVDQFKKYSVTFEHLVEVVKSGMNMFVSGENENPKLIDHIEEELYFFESQSAKLEFFKTNSLPNKHFFYGDIRIDYLETGISAEWVDKLSNFTQNQITSMFFDGVWESRQKFAKSYKTLFVEISFKKFLSLEEEVVVDFKNGVIKPFFVVNQTTALDYKLVKKVIKMLGNTEYVLKINSVLNYQLYESLRLLNPKFVIVGKSLSSNLFEKTLWMQFQVFLSHFRVKKTVFVFEQLTDRLERTKENFLKPYENI